MMIDGMSVREKIMEILSDGERHTKEELKVCLWDDEGTMNNIFFHIQELRKEIEPRGLIVVCETYMGRNHYRLARHFVKSAKSQKA